MGNKKVRGNGEGTVYHDPNPARRLHWIAEVTVGWRPDGRPVRCSRSASSRQEADRLRARMVRSMVRGDLLPDDRLTVGTMLTTWLAGRTDLRPTTLRTWEQTIRNHLVPALGFRRLTRLRPSDVELALAIFPPGVMPIARTVLVRAIGDAQRDGLVDRNVARLARSPRIQRATLHIPTPIEACALIAAAAGHRLGALVITAIGTGLKGKANSWACGGGTYRSARTLVVGRLPVGLDYR